MAKEFGIEKVTYKTFDGQEIVLAEKDVRDICGNTNEYLSRSEIELFMKTAMYRKLSTSYFGTSSSLGTIVMDSGSSLS